METNGTGSIVQLEKDKPKGKCRKWQLRVSVGLDPRTGKYRQRTRTFKGTYTEAKRALPEFIDELSTKTDADRDVTFRECCDLWLESPHVKSLRKTTRDTYSAASRSFGMHLGYARLSMLTAADVEDAAWKLMSGDTLSGSPAKPTTVSSWMIKLSGMFKMFAIKYGYASTNPFADAALPKGTARKPVDISDDEYRRLVCDLRERLRTQGNGQAMGALLALLVGLRKMECVNASWKDIKNGQMHVNGTKTDGSDATVPLSPVALEVLNEWKEQQRGIMERLGLEQLPSTPIATNRWLKRSSRSTLYSWWVCNEGAFGFEGMTFHDLRHAFVTHCCRAKIHPKTIQKLARHRNFLTTMNIYAHVNKEDMENAVLLL